jgi:hypothetical protein
MSIVYQFSARFWLFAQTLPTQPPARSFEAMFEQRGLGWFLIAGVLALLMLLAPPAALSATVVHPGLPDLDPVLPVWSFIATEAKLKIGDLIICRSDTTDRESPWFISQVLAVENDGSVAVLKPLANGVSTLVQLPRTLIVDVARPGRP